MENLGIVTTECPVVQHENIIRLPEDDSSATLFDTPNDGGKNEDTDMEEREKKVENPLETFVPETNELQQGYRILKELMADGNKSVNWPFMDAVDSEATGLFDYYERVKSPMWLRRMKTKFEISEYETITQFVADFRLMLENCYRYNGPDHYVSKRGQRLEVMLEQKLALLSRDLREKTNFVATSGKTDDQLLSAGTSLRRRNRSIAPHDSSALLNQLRQEEALREREARKQQIQERKAAQEAYAQELLDWEDGLLEEPIKTQLKHMWELPQIGLFLFLCQEPLNIGEVVQFELERCFAMARESSTLQSVMTTLLSTPYQRTRLDKKPMMPYKVWEEKLRVRLGQWYKILGENEQDLNKTATKLGLDPYLFEVIGKRNPLEKKKFHELSYYRKIWIVKALCDHCLATQESLRDAIESQPVEEQRDYLLGYDAQGNSYMHFPQFCGADLRIYKQAPFPHPTMPEIEEIPTVKSGKRKHNHKTKTGIKKKKKRRGKDKAPVSTTPRPSRLRQVIKTVLPSEQSELSSSDTDSDSEGTETSVSVDESSTCSSNYASSSTRTSSMSAWRINGSISSKDNTPEPPSFRGKIRKPRDFDSKLNSCSPLTKCLREDDSMSSKDGTPEPQFVLNTTKDRENNDLDTGVSKPRRGRLSRQTPQRENDIQESGLSVDNMDMPCEKDADKGANCGVTQSHSDDNSGKKTRRSNSKSVKNKNKLKLDYALEPSVTTRARYKISLTESKRDLTTASIHNNDISDTYNVKQVENGNVLNKDSGSIEIRNRTDAVDREHCETSILDETVTARQPSNCKSIGRSNNSSTDVESSSGHKNGVECSVDTKSSVHIHGDAGSSVDIKNGSQLQEKGEKIESDHFRITEDGFDESEVKRKSEKDILDLNNGKRDAVLVNSGVDERDGNDKPAVTSEVCGFSGEGVDDAGESNSLGRVDLKCGTKVEEKPKLACSLSLLANTAIANSSATPNNVKHVKAENDSLENDKLSKESDKGYDSTHSQADGNECTRSNQEPRFCDSLKQEPMETADEERCVKDTDVDTGGKQLAEDDQEMEEEELDEVTPEIGPFSLIADNVESLRQLTEQFAEFEAVIPKGKKQKVKPPVRKKCVVELYERLLFLLKELEPWETKLVQATKKARVKLKKEKDEYVDEEEQKRDVEDVWESEESVSEEESSGSEEDGDESQETNVQSLTKLERKHKKTLDYETSSTGRNTPDEEETSMSSRGRLRKRRVIPNNSEDNNKKRKVVKNLEENYSSAGHLPNILQKHHATKADGVVIRTNPLSLLEQLRMPALNADLNKQSPSAALSASQMLLRANLNSRQTGQLASNVTVKTSVDNSQAVQQILGSIPRVGSSHPVIQQLLAQKTPIIIAESGKLQTVQVKSISSSKPANQTTSVTATTTHVLTASSTNLTGTSAVSTATTQIHLAGNKSRKIEIAKPRPTAVQLTIPSQGKAGAKVQHYNQNVLSTLPPEVIQQLLRNHSLRIQSVSSDKTGISSLGGTVILSSPGKEINQSAALQGTVINFPTTSSVQSVHHPPEPTKPILQTNSPSNVLLSTLPQNADSSVNSLPVVRPPISGPSSQDLALRMKVPTSPNKPKYACHVTVKSLLQDRAKKALEFGPDTGASKPDIEESGKDSVPSAAQVLSLASEVGQKLPGVLEMSKSDSPTQPIVVTVNTAIKGLPQTLKLPSKETLDSAVQAVVTSVKTTLPTAHLKVPAPSTMPSIHPRKNVTRTIQSMKAPIPVINASPGVTVHSGPSGSTPGTPIQSGVIVSGTQKRVADVVLSTSPSQHQTMLTTGIAGKVRPQVSNLAISQSTAKVLSQGFSEKNRPTQNIIVPQQNSSVLKLTPQTFMTSQGLVQGFLTPQGLVIPQGALQQGNLATKQVVVANPNMQVNVSSVDNKTLQASALHGKVIKPTMLLSTVVSSSGNLNAVQTQKGAQSAGQTVHAARHLLDGKDSGLSSKLLLQAVNTVSQEKSASIPQVSKSVCVTNRSNITQGSLMSGLSVKLGTEQLSMINKQSSDSKEGSLLSPEIIQINQKGDGVQRGGGEKQTSPNTNILGHNSETTTEMQSKYKTDINSAVKAPSSQGITSSVTGKSSSLSSPISVGKVVEKGLPAAQVLLSLSQGMQRNSGLVKPKQDTLTSQVLSNKGSVSETVKSVQTVPQVATVNLQKTNENPQKLLLLNIGGRLFTSQGIPVTLDNGVLKIADTVSTNSPKISADQPNASLGNANFQVVNSNLKPVQIAATTGPSSAGDKPVGQTFGNPQVIQPHNQMPSSPLVAKIPGSIPIQQVLIPKASNNKSLSSPVPVNVLNTGQIVVKSSLSSPNKVIQPQPLSPAVNISPGSMLTIPSPVNQPIQLVGINNHQQQVLSGKNQLVQVVVPESQAGSAVIGNVVFKPTSQVQKSVVLGPVASTVNQQQGLTVAVPAKNQLTQEQLKGTVVMTGKDLPGRQVSPQKISPKSAVSGIQIIGNYGNNSTGKANQVVFQMVSPKLSPNPVPLAEPSSPWKLVTNQAVPQAAFKATQPLQQRLAVPTGATVNVINSPVLGQVSTVQRQAVAVGPVVQKKVAAVGSLPETVQDQKPSVAISQEKPL